MMSRRRNAFWAAASFAVAVAALVLVAVHPWSRQAAIDGDPVATGRSIYRTGTDVSGQPITRSGGMMGGGMMGGGMMGGGMMGGGCATCHGTDGRGRSTPMFAAPDITYANVTDARGMLEPDGSRGPTFSDATLKRAVIQGIDPEGDYLRWPMPQWQLTDQEWADLLAYWKTLR